MAWLLRLLCVFVLLPLLCGCEPEFRCESDADCTAPKLCRQATCTSACADASECPKGQLCLDGVCSQCKDDAQCSEGFSCRSGACECGAPKSLCGEQCVSLQSSRAHCGKCDNPCQQGQVCQAGACVFCAPGAPTPCGDQCANLQTSTKHCQSCGNALSGGQICVAGKPRCPPKTRLCGKQCVYTGTDPSHCGSCDKACGPHQRCAFGQCVDHDCSKTFPTTTACGLSCIDTTEDPRHCGACDKACRDDQICLKSACACLSGYKECDGACVDTQGSWSHCGACNKACARGQRCHQGQCIDNCPKDTPTACFGGCFDLQTSRQHCGACGQRCPGLQRCQGGRCACPKGLSDCDGTCIDTDANWNHCGACGNVCPSGQRCASGQCIKTCPSKTPTPCLQGCYDLQTSVTHCGACGLACLGDQICVDGTCGCPEGSSFCLGRCIDTQTSSAHCGGCNKPCKAAEFCQAGQCKTIKLCKKDADCLIGHICDNGRCRCVPQPEVCDGRDNNCDGKSDEGCDCINGKTQPCFEGQVGCKKESDNYACLGICRAGTQICVDGKWGKCLQQVLPTAEVCDGKDNDCDGKPDEDLSRPCYTGSSGCQSDGKGGFACKGICKAGTQTCDPKKGEWGPCQNQTQSMSKEICDNDKDDDCDGKIDQACVVTVAGTSQEGFKNGPAKQALFKWPLGLAFDAQGNLFVADRINARIRKISTNGQVTTFAGTGSPGHKDGPAHQALFEWPAGLVFDKSGNLFVAESSNHRIRKITPSGQVTTYAGDGTQALKNGPAAQAQFNGPTALVFDGSGNLYVSDSGNHCIRKITPTGQVTTYAGTGKFGMVDGPVAQAQLFNPAGIAIDKAGNLYVADNFNHRIRKITPSGQVTTYAGDGTRGDKDGPAAQAQFRSPSGMALDPNTGDLYVGSGDRIRKISKGQVTTHVGPTAMAFISGKTGASSLVFGPLGRLYYADGSSQVKRINPP